MSELKTTHEWNKIPWRKLEKKLFKLQKRIYQASSRGDVKTVHKLQRLLMKSWGAKCIAVRRVTQENSGKKTAGVDGVKSLNPKQRLKLVQNLKLSQTAKPTRRVWIPKPHGQEKRPLGIPVIKDRAVQALVKSALEPEWEAHFEPNSYGFRPGRSCHDAIGAIFNAIRQGAKYVLDADISKCFDKINHQALLTKLNTFPSLRHQIRGWLRTGVIDNGELFPTTIGTPQGGCISPLLANIALHGMENWIHQKFPKQQPTVNGKRVFTPSPILIRYADDFVILHKDIEVIQKCQQAITQWLSDMGLELKPSKTKISHTLYKYEGKAGFDFLGFTIRQYPVGKNRTAKNSNGKLLGFKTLITPSIEKIKQHTSKIGKIIKLYHGANQAQLIKRLNPIIRGWAAYYSMVVSKRTYSKVDSCIYQQLFAWAKRRHPKQNHQQIAHKYWSTVGNDHWVFTNKQLDNTLHLIKHQKTPIVRHIKVQAQRSPYDGDWVYWSTRMGRHPEVKPEIAILLKKQKGKCSECGLYFKYEDLLEIDHIIPRSKGGNNSYQNKQLLHRHCHDYKSVNDNKSFIYTYEIDEDYVNNNPF